MDEMKFCCIAVFQYVSIICQCGASADGFTMCHIAKLTISQSLALINSRLFHIYRSSRLPVPKTRHIISQ
jgi:hypothetical protein